MGALVGRHRGQPFGGVWSIAVTVGVIVAALPFFVVTSLTIGQLPGKFWGDQFAPIDAVKGAMAWVPDFPNSKTDKPKLDHPTKGEWFGLAPHDLTVSTRYELRRPTSAQAIIDYYADDLTRPDQIPPRRWKHVATTVTDQEIRAEYRRDALGLLVVITPSIGGLDGRVDEFWIRVGRFNGQTLRK